jgi:hypothetical protein
MDAGKKEGQDFGKGTDNQGCLDASVARNRKAQGITEMMKSSIFLRSCLEASRPTPEFCDGVPGVFEITKTVQWRKEQCQKYDMSPDDPGCTQLFQQVQQFCVQPAFDKRHPTDGDPTPTR